MNKQTPDEGLLLTEQKINSIIRKTDWLGIGDKTEREWLKRRIKIVAKAQLAKAFNTPITIEGGVCPKCDGKKAIEVGVLKGGVFSGGNIDCPICKGIGKLPDKTFTIKEAIERMMKDAR